MRHARWEDIKFTNYLQLQVTTIKSKRIYVMHIGNIYSSNGLENEKINKPNLIVFESASIRHDSILDQAKVDNDI